MNQAYRSSTPINAYHRVNLTRWDISDKMN